MTARREPLTIIVPCFNNESHIEACLRSVAWAEEVILVDSFSTDRTREIGARYATRILTHVYENSASQKNWAIPQAANGWVMIVDTDEIVTEELRREVEDALAHPGGFGGFRIPRRNIVFGRWVRHGRYWPDHALRLFRKDAARYENRRVHADVIVDGPVGTITAPYLHYPHRSWRSIRQTLLGRYSRWEALQKQDEGVRFSWTKLIVRPAGAFVDRNFVHGGVRDGWRGWLLSAVWAVYVAKTYWTLRGLERRGRGGQPDTAGTGDGG